MTQIQIGWAARPIPSERVCGDVVAEVTTASSTTVALIDGLGHGPKAATAATAAADLIRAKVELELDQLFHACDQALRSTVGVSMTIIRIDHATAILEHAGVGNVEMTGITAEPVASIPRPGYVGGRMRKVFVSRQQLHPGDRLVLFSDGVSRRFDHELLRGNDPQQMAKAVVAKHSKSHDDASCVVLVVRP